MLNAGVGLSIEGNSLNAGREVAKIAMEGLNGKPKVAFLAVDFLCRKKLNYPDVLKGIRDVIGPIPLVGSTVNGIMVNDRFALKSVGLMLLGGDINVDADFLYEKSRLNYLKIAEQINQIKANLPPHPNRLMFMFQDGMKFPPKMTEQSKSLNSRMVSLLSGMVSFFFKKKLEEIKEQGLGMPTVQELIEELVKKGWDIPIVGNVATNLRDYDSIEFHNDNAIEDAVTGVILSAEGNTKFGYAFQAGASYTGISCIPTTNIGSFLLKINNKPALIGFCEALGINKDSLHELKSGGYLNYYNLLGQLEKKGDKEIIHLTATITNPTLDSLLQTGFPFEKVPKKIEMFQSTMKDLLKSTEIAMDSAIKNIGTPKFLLGMDCAIRLIAYGDNLPKVISLITDKIGKDTPRMLIGSGGEIFATKDTDYYFNNMTFVGLAGGQ